MIDLLPLELKVGIAAALAAGALAAAFSLVRAHDAAVVAAAVGPYAAAAASASEAARAEEARTRNAQTENANENQRLAAKQQAAIAADAERAGSAAQQLRDAIAARSGQVPGDSDAARQCATDRDAFAAILEEGGKRFLSLAGDADRALAESARRLSECAADYDSLTPGAK